MCRVYPEITPKALQYIKLAWARVGASRFKGVSPYGDDGQVLHYNPDSPKDKEAPAYDWKVSEKTIIEISNDSRMTTISRLIFPKHFSGSKQWSEI